MISNAGPACARNVTGNAISSAETSSCSRMTTCTPKRERCSGGRSFRTGLARPKGRALRVVLLVHPAPEDPPAEWTEPAEHVIHVAEVHQLNQIAVEILGEEKRVTARRSLRLAHTLDASADQVVVPALKISYVERDVREADLVPRNRLW